MATHNKIVLAASVFTEAHTRYVQASRDTDYVVSILLSGAVMGIVSPLLKEQGGHTAHELLARITRLVEEPGDEPVREGVFRAVYNGLKHSGDPQRGVAASQDLTLQADLRLEAARMLEDARADFVSILIGEEVRSGLSPQFVALVSSTEEYA